MDLQGSGPRPPLNILQIIANEAYKKNATKTVGSLRLFYQTPTLKFYTIGNTIVVGVRGTFSIEDGKADALIAVNKLQESNRFQNDVGALKFIQSKYPPTRWDYYGVGHSLGGAILDLFIRLGLIKSAVSYNPAIQPSDLQLRGNDRIYSKNDPLYKLYKPLGVQADVREGAPLKWWEKLVGAIPVVGKAYQQFQGHQLDNFQGGGKNTFFTQLKEIGYEPSAYLKEAKRRAKENNYPYKLLGFADDGVHKLAIPDFNGKIVRFGRVGYGDHLIWSHLEATGKAPKGKATQKRNTFRKSHSKIRGDWEKKPFSPNNLAIHILW
jgi:hypothetical protein